MKKYLIIAVAAVLFAACSNDSEISRADNSARVPIQLGTTIDGTTTRSNSQTIQTGDPNATPNPIPGYLTNGKKVGVYIYYTTKQEEQTMGSGKYGFKNLEYTVNGSAGALDYPTGNQPYFPELKTQNIDIYAFSPRIYTGTGELKNQTAVTFNTVADQTDPDNYIASDFVWGVKSGVTSADAASTINIPLSHKLSKINVNITNGTGVSLSSLLGASITLAGVNLAGEANLTDGSVATTGSTTSLLTLTSATAAPTGKLASSSTTDCYTASAVIIPQAITSQDLTITLSGGTTSYKYSLTNTFAAGTCYTYDITINAGGLTLTTTISNWTAGATTTGTAE